MNWIDITILVLLAVTTIKGLFDGFVKQVSSLLGIVLGIAFAGLFFQGFKSLLLKFFSDMPEVIATALGYIIAFLIIFVVIRCVGILLHKIFRAASLGSVDYFFGGVLGAVKCLLIVSLLLNAIDRIDPEAKYLIPKKVKQSSYLYYTVKSIVPTLYHMDLFKQKG